jgi:hypothetical protein
MAISVDTRYRHCAALRMSTTFLRNLLPMSLEPTNVYGVTARQTVMVGVFMTATRSHSIVHDIRSMHGMTVVSTDVCIQTG